MRTATLALVAMLAFAPPAMAAIFDLTGQSVTANLYYKSQDYFVPNACDTNNNPQNVGAFTYWCAGDPLAGNLQLLINQGAVSNQFVISINFPLFSINDNAAYILSVTSSAFVGLTPEVTASVGTCFNFGYYLPDATGTFVVYFAPPFAPCANAALVFAFQAPVCFPASSTLRRLASAPNDDDTKPANWETVALPDLRVGDTVECLAREPVFRGTVTSAAYGRLARCIVYGYKKALPAEAAAATPYTRIAYEAAEGPDAPAGEVTMSRNHHLLDPVTGQARQAGSLRAGDHVLRVTPSGAMVPARVASVATVQEGGAYVPLLSGGGLPIIDGVVAYPSSGESDVGLDSKHWGQHFLHAPLWQVLPHEATGDDKGAAALPAHGRSLSELGAREPVAAFTRKWHAVGAAAAREGRSSCDWAGVAAEMHAAIQQGKRFTEAEALQVFERHHSAPRGVVEA